MATLEIAGWLWSVWQWLGGFSRLEWIVIGVGLLILSRVGDVCRLLWLVIGLLQAANYRLDRMSYAVRHQEDEHVYQSYSEWEKNDGRPL